VENDHLIGAETRHRVSPAMIVGKLDQDRLLAISGKVFDNSSGFPANKPVFRDVNEQRNFRKEWWQVHASSMIARTAASGNVTRGQPRVVLSVAHNPPAPNQGAPNICLEPKVDGECSTEDVRRNGSRVEVDHAQEFIAKPSRVRSADSQRGG
jgi:hypothetical protein